MTTQRTSLKTLNASSPAFCEGHGLLQVHETTTINKPRLLFLPPCFSFSIHDMTTEAEDDIHGTEQKIKQRASIAKNPLETNPTANQPRGNIPNTPLASSTIAFLLGATFAFGFLTVFLDTPSSARILTYQLGFFVAAWAFFHWAEFAVTAGWNLEKCSVDSYLLENGAMYHVANGTALLEYLIFRYLLPSSKSWPYVSQIGMLMVIGGQVLRSTAMIHASTNFSHSVAFLKRDTHRLVTDGVYGWFRHPSYAGFYYWALGTQLVLQNPLTFVMFTILLWRFFYYRTRAEESALVKFFGVEYANYRRRVGTKIPFVP
ncbi:Isoprenylcysteine carboxyl methyltransferase family-domain-containing protein [Gymnopilus junonius]|uniref:Protein-S-isoprenylcysteine O-methyltransferase n=1 Tax=Gymnopilus junonius TaxID=109634 RepID=A0A9P5P1T2_GYMJU|nr:Isoprenylcysteine carboxyl methyltransferase family-domain-containing protein [Gymnopilus junonius]